MPEASGQLGAQAGHGSAQRGLEHLLAAAARLLAPFFAGLWVMLGRRGLEPSAPAKFGIALLQMGFANLVLVWGAVRALRGGGLRERPLLRHR